MKIVREEIDYKKQMENNNKNMKKSEETDTVIAVDPTYADAMEQDKKAEEKVGEIMKKKKEEQKSVEIPDPSTGKPLKKNMYTEKEELDESLFDGGEGEEVEEEKNSTKLPGDVFTMVYDFIFDGLHKSPAEIKGLEDVEDVVVGAEKYFQDVQNFTNIGVQIRNDEKDIAEYVKKIADALGFSTSEKRYERGVKNGDYVLFVEIPKDVAVMKASKFLKKDESLKEENKINEKGLTRSERHNRMMDKIFNGHDKYVDKMANFLSERGVSDEEIAELKKGVGLGKDALRDKIVELGLEDEFKKTSESLKEGKKLTETWEGEDILDRLAKDANAFIRDGNSKEKAIEKAVDEGLVANWDRVVLGWHYDVIDTAKILEDIYPMLVRDIEERLDKEEDEDEEDDSIEEKMEQTVDGYKYNGVGIRKSQNSAKETIWSCEGNVFPTLKDAKAFIDKKQVGKDKKDEGKKLTEDAKIYISLSDYKPWSGAVDTFEKIREEGKMDELDAFIEETYPDGLTDTELNDLLWFEPEYVFDSLGIDYDKDEDEEDEDEDELELDFEEEDEEETDEE